MARIHGKASQYSYNALALQDELESVSQTISVAEANITSFTDTYANPLAGKKDVKTEISGSADVDDLVTLQGWKTLFAGMGAGPKSTVFDPVGTGPGANAPEYQCTLSGLTGALVANLKLSLPVGGAAKYTATIQHSGSTTRAVA